MAALDCLSHQVRATLRTLATALGSSAFRADFFIRWPKPGAEKNLATLYLNEIEHGFGAGRMLAWFGMPLTDYAMRSWALGGDEAQRRRFAQIASAATAPSWTLAVAKLGTLETAAVPSTVFGSARALSFFRVSADKPTWVPSTDSGGACCLVSASRRLSSMALCRAQVGTDTSPTPGTCAAAET